VYRDYDNAYGTPITIYREPDEIRSDIVRVKDAIREINSRLNVREIMFEMINKEEKLSPEEIVNLLEDMLSEAESALARLSELRDELSLLEEELYEVKCEIKGL